MSIVTVEKCKHISNKVTLDTQSRGMKANISIVRAENCEQH